MQGILNISFHQSQLIINSLLALIYVLLFFLLVETLLKRPAIRNLFTFGIAVLCVLLAGMFMARIFMPAPVKWYYVESIWVIVVLLPAILFLYFRNQFSGAEQSMAALERFNLMKDEFLSVASHELRTPLSIINGFAEILVREKLGPMNDEQKRRVRKILMQGQRLNRIVDELLDLSRIRSGKVHVRKDVFDLIPVLKVCLDDHRIVCDQQKIELIDQIPDILPDVTGDLERVTQIVVNLLNNAIKYTESGGQVIVTASFQKEKEEVIIEVKDTGIGIAPHDQARVFEEFYRSVNPEARKFSGSGLGLAIVKQLVEAQGGRVGLHSEGLGKGSTFFFTLKASQTAKEKKSPSVFGSFHHVEAHPPAPKR